MGQFWVKNEPHFALFLNYNTYCIQRATCTCIAELLLIWIRILNQFVKRLTCTQPTSEYISSMCGIAARLLDTY